VTHVKICGCMRVDDAIVAAQAGADFVGLVFADESRRRLSTEQALQIVRALGTPLRDLGQAAPPPHYQGDATDVVAWFHHGAEALERLLARKRPLTVGVFEDQPLEQVDAIADEASLDLIQLSGGESWQDCLLANRQVIKVVNTEAFASADDLLAALEPGTAIAFLLDSSRGRGRRADWSLARDVASRLPLILAGGLTPENVSNAVRKVRPWAVDVSSGVETDGAKDPDKIRAFIAAVREAPSRNVRPEP
jgi:phosphoribosylanthranilate isomerase